MSLVDRTIGRYRITGKLGEGGMGVVYRAEDQALGRPAAIKVLQSEGSRDPDRVRRFTQEARAASALNHPNIVTVYDVGEFEGEPYLVMELVDGESLRARMGQGALPLPMLLDIGVQAATALARAHENGITHRDLKPENILVRKDGYVKVLDFGLAKLKERTAAAPDVTADVLTRTAAGSVLGTAAYMSPEQALGREVDGRSDVFSLALLLLECWARHPFLRGNALDTLHAIVHEPLPAMSLVPGSPEWALARTLAKALEKDPDERYQTMKDLAIDLRRLKQESDSGGQTTVAAVPPDKPRSAKSLAWAAIAVVLAVAAIAGYMFLAARARGPAITSIAVLPFTNAAADPDTEYLSDGITESLINSLAQMPNLTVKSRNMVFRYKGKDADAEEVGRKLGVQAVLTGRVVQRGDQLTVSAALVDVRDSRQIWGEQYARKLADVLNVQEEISRAITEKLRLKLSGADQKRLARRYTQNSEAYQAYLKGRYHWNRRTEEGNRKGLEYFQQALEKDPGFALAYAGIADSYLSRGFSFDAGAVRPREGMPKAEAAARKALELDPDLAEAHTSLAFVRFLYDWNWADAEKEFERALELNPNYATAHHWYSHFLLPMGRNAESLAASKRAIELDPLDTIINVHLGWHYLYSRQYDLTIEQLRKAHDLDPRSFQASWMLGQAYEFKGMLPEAIAEFHKAVSATPERVLATAALGRTYALAGQTAQAREILGSLKSLSRQRYVSPFFIAAIHIALGEKDAAFEWLEKAFQERSDLMVYLKVEPRLDPLRSDPRFADLVRRVGLP